MDERSKDLALYAAWKASQADPKWLFDLLLEVYKHGENSELHAKIRKALGIAEDSYEF